MTYLFQVLKIQVAVFNDIEGLVTEDLAAVCLENWVKFFGQAKLLSVFGRHFK